MMRECARDKLEKLSPEVRNHIELLLFFLETREELLYFWRESRWAFGGYSQLVGLAVSCGMKPPSFWRNALRGVAEDLRALSRDGWRLRPQAQRRYNEPRPKKPERPSCGAKCRSGRPCQAPVYWPSGEASPRSRCRLHGGSSTGPKTQEGRTKISNAQKARWTAWRKAPKPTQPPANFSQNPTF